MVKNSEGTFSDGGVFSQNSKVFEWQNPESENSLRNGGAFFLFIQKLVEKDNISRVMLATDNVKRAGFLSRKLPQSWRAIVNTGFLGKEPSYTNPLEVAIWKRKGGVERLRKERYGGPAVVLGADMLSIKKDAGGNKVVEQKESRNGSFCLSEIEKLKQGVVGRYSRENFEKPWILGLSISSGKTGRTFDFGFEMRGRFLPIPEALIRNSMEKPRDLQLAQNIPPVLDFLNDGVMTYFLNAQMRDVTHALSVSGESLNPENLGEGSGDWFPITRNDFTQTISSSMPVGVRV